MVRMAMVCRTAYLKVEMSASVMQLGGLIVLSRFGQTVD